MAHKVDTKSQYGDGRRWDRWNKQLNLALERSVEAGRSFIEDSYQDVFDVPKPTEQSYRKCGLKIAYHLQEMDARATGSYSTCSDKLKERFRQAAKFGHVDTLSGMDPWGMDTGRPNRTGNPQNLKPKEKSQRHNDIDSLIEEIMSGKRTVTCGKGTKGETVFTKGKQPNTLEVKAKKNPFTYSINKDWDRNALYWRLWRWSRKEDILA